LNDSITCCKNTNTHLERPRRSIDRRGMLSRLIALVAAFFAGVRSVQAQKRLALSLDKAEKLKNVGGFTVLKIQDKEILFIRDSEDKIRAVNPVCSHKKCLVTYTHEQKRIVCPCHGSNYDLDGSVLKGPSEKPLQVYEAELDLQKSRIIFTVE
jgi:Rieske Fe-S protein